MIELRIVRRFEFECAKADFIERLVVDAESFVRILDELMNGKRCVVRLDDLERKDLRQNFVEMNNQAAVASRRLTVSETFGDGTTENVLIMRSGNSSRILAISSVPMPEPVPPPSECVSWKP